MICESGTSPLVLQGWLEALGFAATASRHIHRIVDIMAIIGKSVYRTSCEAQILIYSFLGSVLLFAVVSCLWTCVLCAAIVYRLERAPLVPLVIFAITSADPVVQSLGVPVALALVSGFHARLDWCHALSAAAAWDLTSSIPSPWRALLSSSPNDAQVTQPYPNQVTPQLSCKVL